MLELDGRRLADLLNTYLRMFRPCGEKGPQSRLFGAAVAVCMLALATVAALAWAGPTTLDQGFSGDGRRTFGFGNGDLNDVANAVAVQEDGKTVVAGYSSNNLNGQVRDFAVARLKTNGGLDSTFSSDGKRTFGFGNGDGNDVAYGVAIQPNGKIVVAGSSDQSVTEFAVARLNANGSLDQTFSGDGKLTFHFVGGGVARGVALQPDGKIVLGGYAFGGGPTGTDFAVARLNPGGGFDDTFSGDGKRTFGFANGNGEDRGHGLAIQADGRIVIAGQSVQGSTGTDFAVARVTTTGALDDTFSGDGKRTFGFLNLSAEDIAYGVSVHGGKAVVAGYSLQAATDKDFAVARLTGAGALDGTFSSDGKRTFGFGNGNKRDEANAVAIQADGRIVMGGYSLRDITTIQDFAVARVTTSGGLDPSFSGNGRQTFDFGQYNDGANAVALQGGKIVMAGFAQPSNGAHFDFAVARLLGS
jgi:uncharacterized delta-60 repeat protein